MSSVVSEGIILVGVVVAAALLSVSFMSSIADMQSSTMSATRDIGVTIRTSVEVIHAVNVTNKNIKIWVKNVGSNPIYDGEIERADLRARLMTPYSLGLLYVTMSLSPAVSIGSFP